MAGPAQVLCGFKSSTHCLRGGETIRSGATRALRRCRGPDLMLRGSQTAFIEEAMWLNCVTRVHAGPRAC